MSTHQLKLMAAGVLLALGLGIGSGAGWLTTADAQETRRDQALTPEEKVRQLEAQLERAKREWEDQKRAETRKASDEVARLATGRWQYAFVPVKDVDAEGFVKLLREREASGWDYSGQTTLKKEAVWAFRRPLGGQTRTLDMAPWGNLTPLQPGAFDQYVPSDPSIKGPAKNNPAGRDNLPDKK